MRSILLECGCEVSFFESIHEFMNAKSFDSTEIILVDLCLPPPRQKIQGVIKKIHSIRMHAPIIPFFSRIPLPSELFKALDLGLRQILLPTISASTLIPEIFKSCDAAKKGSTDMKILALTHTQYLSLTQRERQVCDLLAKGHKNIHIGDSLKITAATVKAHKARVMKKMKVGSVQDLAVRICKMDSFMTRTAHDFT